MMMWQSGILVRNHLEPGAIIGDGDRKRGVHAAPSKKTNVLFLEKNCATLNVINARGYTQICIQQGRAGYDQGGYNYLISSMSEYIIVLITKNAITNSYKIKKEKKRERNFEIKGNKNRSRSHD